MSVVVLPRKVAGVILCLIGGVSLIGGVFGDSSRNAGPVVAILLGSLFAVLGWMSIKSARPTQTSVAGQKGSAMARSTQQTAIPAAPSVSAQESGGEMDNHSKDGRMKNGKSLAVCAALFLILGFLLGREFPYHHYVRYEGVLIIDTSTGRVCSPFNSGKDPYAEFDGGYKDPSLDVPTCAK